MTRRELNLAIFAGTADRPLWQPRLEEWINWNRTRDTLPARYADLDNSAIYDDLRCSVRYPFWGLGLNQTSREGLVECWEEPGADENHVVTHHRTGSGTITTVRQLVRENGRVVNDRIREFPVKTPQDLRVLMDMVEAQEWTADPAAYAEADAQVGPRGEPNMFLNSSGFTDLIKFWAGLPGTYYLLTDAPAVVDEYMEACDRRDDRQLEAALQLPAHIYNLGDHATNEFTPPPILKRYLLPRWQKTARLMSEHGRYVHTHWDGNSAKILPFLQESGLHGVEALPPLPMGDMTLEEIKAAVGENIVALDLIPTTHFLEHFSLEECLEFAQRVMEMFTPRLILGVSDEISGVGQIQRIEAISELVDKLYGLPD
ncbi:MAG: hypothetical protein GX100_04965 [candidate division WS1 bacterium]|nr:hypothetical protein [candidate division WS1 bacterium]